MQNEAIEPRAANLAVAGPPADAGAAVKHRAAPARVSMLRQPSSP